MSNNSPITLVTATPGGGKTAAVVKMIKEAIAAGRPVFQQGIPDLKLPYIPVPPIPEWTELRPDPDNPDQTLPYFTFPENALLVLDEAQRIYRVRSAASKMPDHVAAWETIRHTGITAILITQDPSFLDSHIRKLVGQHIHLIDFGVLGRRYYEWPYCAEPNTFKSAPIKKKYTLPKEVFPLYKSSSLHIKRNYSIPPALIVLAMCLMILVAGGWYLTGSVSKKMAPVVPASQKEKAPQEQQREAFAGQVGTTPEQLLLMFNPIVPGRPETAPAYEPLRVVKQMPVVVGCMQTKKSCTCYTQQATNAGLDAEQCRTWISQRPFDAYSEPLKEVSHAPKDTARHEPGVSGQGVPRPQQENASKIVPLAQANDSTNPRFNVAMRP